MADYIQPQRIRELWEQHKDSPHAFMTAMVTTSGLDLGSLHAIIEEFDVERSCYVCNKPVDKAMQCGRCKAVVYCSTRCQQYDWSTGPSPSAQSLLQRLPHRALCHSLKVHLKAHSATEELERHFPWLRLTSSGTFPLDAVLATLGLLGTGKGYWSQPDTRKPHAGAADASKGYGTQLAAIAHPTDRQGWLLPDGDFPRLQQSLASDTAGDLPQPPREALTSWRQYYEWRGLPLSSVCALRLYFVRASHLGSS